MMQGRQNLPLVFFIREIVLEAEKSLALDNIRIFVNG